MEETQSLLHINFYAYSPSHMCIILNESNFIKMKKMDELSLKKTSMIVFLRCREKEEELQDSFICFFSSYDLRSVSMNHFYIICDQQDSAIILDNSHNKCCIPKESS